MVNEIALLKGLDMYKQAVARRNAALVATAAQWYSVQGLPLPPALARLTKTTTRARRRLVLKRVAHPARITPDLNRLLYRYSAPYWAQVWRAMGGEKNVVNRRWADVERELRQKGETRAARAMWEALERLEKND